MYKKNPTVPSNKKINFRKQSLRGQSFENQQLTNADFSYSDIRDTNFSGAILKGANFSHALASDANFSKADIRGARLTHSNLIRANFESCTGGLRPAVTVSWVIITVLLSAILGIANFYASDIPFSDTPLIASLDNNAYQQYFLIPRTVALVTILIFMAISVWNGFAKSLAVVTIAVTGLFLVSSVVAAVIAPDAVWHIVDYSLWITAGSLAWAVFGTMTLTISAIIIGVLLSPRFLILPAGVATLSIVAIGLDWINAFSPASKAGLQVLAIAIGLNFMSMLLAWRGVKGEKNYLWLRKLVVFLISKIGSTDFKQANLSGASFINTQLKGVSFNFRTNLETTCFHRVIFLELADVGGTYLNQDLVQDILVGKRCDYENINPFHNLNLKGTNLNKRDLTGIDLSGSDLSHACLQDVNLSQAILVNTNLDGADLTGANLTGATIENWSITSSTKLNGIQCRYVFMKAIAKGKFGQNPLRKPDSYSEEFQDGEFEDFIRPLFTTLDLYHREDVDPRAIAISYKQLEAAHPEAELDILAIEKRGKDKNGLLLKVEAAREANLSELSDEYRKLYQQVKSLSKTEIVFLISENSRQINHLTHQIESLVGSFSHRQSYSPPQVNAIVDFVVLTFSDGDFDRGFTINALIWSAQYALPTIIPANLPPAPELQAAYQTWKKLYCALVQCNSRITIDEDENPTNISRQELDKWSLTLEKSFNQWLCSESFTPLVNKLRDKFQIENEFPIVIQSSNSELCRLPWHLWNFVKSRPNTEVTIGNLCAEPVRKSTFSTSHRRILAILGNSQGIDVETDRHILENLKECSAEVSFLVEPRRNEFYDVLSEPEGWDIIYFAGHSHSLSDDKSGILKLNHTEYLKPSELYYALGKAVSNRLQLAIINSCDGLGIARKLEELKVPHVIVMKEPVADEVAQAFLKSFLSSFSQGKTLYAAFREARHRLEILQDRFPCASWLPVLFKNSAEAPMIW